MIETQLCKLHGTSRLCLTKYTIVAQNVRKIEKCQLWVRPIECLKLSLASCEVHLCFANTWHTDVSQKKGCRMEFSDVLWIVRHVIADFHMQTDSL